MMKILLHTCCAPCLIYPLDQLKKKGFEVRAIFYNPNIHPLGEYLHRRREVEKIAQAQNLQVFYPEYRVREFFQAVYHHEDKGERCPLCWRLRLKKTAEIAKANNIEAFTSTLLVSPYQDQSMLKIIGDDIAKEYALNFYYEDFRPGFRQAHKEAKEQGIYCQNYCGCLYSEIERQSRQKLSIKKAKETVE
jgi:predicted adenine nucleotide alpha hydrolase (AANH) superfamily ATPase